MKHLRMKGQASTPSKLLKGYAYGGRVARADGGRVSKLTQGYAAGGMIGDELSEDMGLGGFDHGEPDGDEAMPRLDKPMRGKGNTTVNVIVSAPAKPEAPPMPPPMPMMAPKPLAPPMGPPPGPGGPPGGGNMGMPPPPPLPGIRKSGGRVGYKVGGVVKRADGGKTKGKSGAQSGEHLESPTMKGERAAQKLGALGLGSVGAVSGIVGGPPAATSMMIPAAAMGVNADSDNIRDVWTDKLRMKMQGRKDGGAVKHPGKDRVDHIMSRRNGGKIISAGAGSGVGRLEKYAAGGKVMDAGAGSGIGRLEKNNLPIPKR